MPTIVVGVDGSQASLDALRWAQGVAGPDTRVRAVSAWTYPAETGPRTSMESYYLATSVPIDVVEDNARRIASDAVEMVRVDGVDVTAEAAIGVSPVAALLGVAEEADLLVVGTRPHSKLERVIGTTAIQCAHYAPCPFVAVPESAPDLADLIAVAFDGSEPASRALVWAAEIAERQGLDVRVLAAWEDPDGPAADSADPVSPHDRAVEALHTAVDTLVPGLADRAELVPIEASGRVAARLIDAAEGATAMVMGSRGHGGFKGLLLGSVSQRMLEASPMPVVILRA